jgi:uncharacterized protein
MSSGTGSEAPSDRGGDGAATIEIRDVPERDRYLLTVDGQNAGIVTYALGGDGITLIHTGIRPEFGGQGLAQKLAVFVLDDARARGLRVRPQCPFMASYIRRHPRYQDLVDRESAGS